MRLSKRPRALLAILALAAALAVACGGGGDAVAGGDPVDACAEQAANVASPVPGPSAPAERRVKPPPSPGASWGSGPGGDPWGTIQPYVAPNPPNPPHDS